MNPNRREQRTNRIDRRTLLQLLGVTGVAGMAGCLGGDGGDDDGGNGTGDAADDNGDDASDDAGDDEAPAVDDSETDTDDEDGDPYLREELENAIETLDAPDPGSATVVFENDGEYHTEDVECSEDSSDPEKGGSEGFFEFEDGEAFSVELNRIDDTDGIRNTITLSVPNPDEDSQYEEAEVPRSLWPIKPEEGADGRSAFVIREDGTWYGGIEFDLSDIESTDYGETLVAITCG